MPQADCPLCKMLKGEIPAKKIYEDDKIVIGLHPIPAHKGHLIIFGREHKQIISEIDDDILKKMFDFSRKLSSMVFDAFAAQGTNVLIQNGEAAGQTINHFCIHVIPRTPADGVNFEWQPKPADEAQLSELEQKISAAIKDATETGDPGNVIKGDNNYMVRQLQRIP